jgi:hypothetical protein
VRIEVELYRDWLDVVHQDRVVEDTYPGHENDTVDAHAPFFDQHGSCFLPEFTRGHCSLAGLFGFEELL